MKSIFGIFIFSFLVNLPLHSQILGTNVFSVSIGKSLYTTPDQGLSFGDAFILIPDVEIGMYINTIRLSLDFGHYDALYPIRYAEGDIEERKFSVFNLTCNKQRILNSGAFDISIGAGLSLRFLNELEILAVIMTSGGWYEIFSDRNRTTSLGAILSTDCRYDLTRRLYIEASLSYNAYLNSYNMGRMGLSVGYYLGR